MKIFIIGQGIAGTLLAHALRLRGAQVTIADCDLPGRASAVAAGIINPVTGKRFVKSWRFDEFFPVARATYQALEQELGVSVWHEQPIVRLLGTAEEANDWSLRCGQPAYADYLRELPDAGAWQPFVPPGFRFGLIRQAARVHFAPLLAAFREQAKAAGFFQDKNIDYQDVTQLAATYDRVIFCDGYRSAAHPLWSYLPWRPAKGEALLLRFGEHLPVAELHEMLKKTTLLVPLGDGLFWAGASYQWYYPDLEPSKEEKNLLLQNLHSMLAVPFKVVDHVAGVRPTVKDRRPFLGWHPKYPRLGIFNGLGTKGALLAPFWAAHFAAHILEGQPLDEEVDVKRVPLRELAKE